MIDPQVKRFLDIVGHQVGHQHFINRLKACEENISSLTRQLRDEQALKEAILIARKRAGMEVPSEYSDIYLGDSK